jgi:hypothetical protein
VDDNRIEYIALSLYAVEHSAHNWEQAPEFVKQEFRLYARSAIDILNSEHFEFDKLELNFQDYSPQVEVTVH